MTPPIRRRAARPILWLALVAALLGGGLAAPPALAFEDRSAHVVIDAATGEILSARKPNHLRYPASLTKMMTVLMLFRALDAGTITMDTEIPFSQTASAAAPVKLGLPPGDSITVAEAIPALIARSANDVAVAVAEALAGTEDLFALEMTRVAREELEMTRTTFRNASGLPNDDHLSTARDMARLAQALWRDHAARFPVFATTAFSFRGQNLPTYNPMMSSYPGADGIKTGFTCAAGYNLAGTAMRDGRRVIAVVMGAGSSAERLSTITGLMNDGFDRLSGDDGEDAASADFAALPMLTLAGLTTPRPLRAMPPPDTEGCGSSGVYAGGWGVTLGAYASRGHARNLAVNAARRGGGRAMTAPMGTGGMVRHHALVTGLSQGQAQALCRAHQAGGQYCLVRSPQMIQGIMQAATRLRRSMR